ncbi:MAG: hypothetical protein AUI14_21710 [Actinobacteria bacterium 13_2_20CM_2_71_6]|nr:MAG: hypothetical protein AUI14_21710 [Actinobacteria bacterium 13_2_20CM_2_71_6]
MSFSVVGSVVAILRGRRAGYLDAVLDVVVEAGIRSLEITLDTPGALDAIRRAGSRYGPEVTVGAGTVRTVSDVDAAVDAGARFLVSPHTDPARDIREPLSDIPIVPTGGVSAENAAEWLAAGAVAVGVGGSLIGDALDGGDLGALSARATAIMKAVAG